MLRFTIRDVLLVTLVVAIAVAWFVDRRAWRIEREKLRKEQEVLQAVSRANEVEAIAMGRALQLERARSESLKIQIESLKADSVVRELLVP